MKQTLLRLREPAVVVVLVVLAIRVLLAPASFVYFLRGGAGGDALALAFFSVTYTATDPLTVVALAALLATCALTAPTSHVRRLTAWSLVVAGLGVLLALAATIGWLALSTPEGLGLADAARVLIGLVVPVLAVVALIRLLKAQPRDTDPQPALDSAATDPADREAGGPRAVEAAQDPGNAPTWQPDVAAGAAWLKAGDAASGAAASGWGRPGEAGGWLPQPADGESHRASTGDSSAADGQRGDSPHRWDPAGEPRPELGEQPRP